MTTPLLGWIVGSAVLFAAIYYPALHRFTLAFASPYAKADLGKRLSATMVDGLVLASTWVLYRQSGMLLYPAAGALYALLRDGLAGRSIGKFCAGLYVIDLPAARPCGVLGSVQRNVFFLLPGANLVAVVLEISTVVGDPQGQRLGDRVAHTQVVEGFGAKDVVFMALDWWRDFVSQLDGSPRKPRRVRSRA